jgi:hypothetical protein
MAALAETDNTSPQKLLLLQEAARLQPQRLFERRGLELLLDPIRVGLRRSEPHVKAMGHLESPD